MNDIFNSAGGTGWRSPAIKKAIDLFLTRLPEALLPPISRVLLYGSYARGDFRADSDVDLAVVLAGADPGDETHFNLQMRLSVIRTYVIAQTLISISAVLIWEDDLRYPDSKNNPDFYRSVAGDGIQLTDRA